jgi:DNA-binding protein H-NS
MMSEERTIIQRVIERYVRTGSIKDEQVQVTILAENKSSAMEKIGEENRSVMLDAYQVDETKVWSGYSSRNNMVYLSIVKKKLN